MADWVGAVVSAVDVLAVMQDCICYLSNQDNLAGYEAEQMERSRAAVADMQKHYAMLLRGQKHAIEMLRGERRKERAEIDAMAEYRDLAEAALARCGGAK